MVGSFTEKGKSKGGRGGEERKEIAVTSAAWRHDDKCAMVNRVSSQVNQLAPAQSAQSAQSDSSGCCSMQ